MIQEPVLIPSAKDKYCGIYFVEAYNLNVRPVLLSIYRNTFGFEKIRENIENKYYLPLFLSLASSKKKAVKNKS